MRDQPAPNPCRKCKGAPVLLDGESGHVFYACPNDACDNSTLQSLFEADCLLAWNEENPRS